tara:strand:+ start:183 stop:488 length:306 start_codon:yes stop_codon:yes gene_type:complete
MPRAKKQDINSFGRAHFVDWSVRRTCNEAANVARWNPPLALEWFNEATERLDAFSDDYEYYNKVAKATNRLWTKMETYQWYDKNDYWGKLPIKRVPLMGDY